MTDLKLTKAEQALILRKRHSAKIKSGAPAKIASRPFPAAQPRAAGQRDPRQRDAGFLSWLHQGLPCVACQMEGVRTGQPIEAAHQKLAIAAKGWREGGLGPRIHDARCVPLCRTHHTEAPNACDKGQRQFWDRMGLGDGIADLCADLHKAFRDGADGAAVIRRHVASVRRAA